jgi:hypothetical protein
MSDAPYTNRELDAKFEAVAQVSTTNRQALEAAINNIQNVIELRLSDLTKNTADSLSRIELQNDALDKKSDAIDAKVSFTNGKVRKINIAIVLLAGIIIGMNYNNWHDIIALLTSLH